MTKKETNLSGTLSEAVSVATSVAYTRQEIQKLKTEFVSLLEKKTTEVIVEQVPGPVGPRGALGATGAQGPKGDKGDVGERGEKGDVGQQGEIGPEGPQGIKGDKGDTGEVGPQGIAGERGPQGLKGDRGEDGKNGLDGRDGKAGEIGPIGLTGQQGIQGERGAKGDTGEKGERGERGERGENGRQGIQGSVGPRGEIGPQGIQGIPGKDGKDADIKPVEEKFQKFIDNVQRDVNSFKTKVNAAILKSGPNDAWKATGSGEVNLRYLDDIDRDSITDGYVLSYDASTSKFKFVEQSAPAGGVGTLQQVTIAGNTTSRGMTTSTLAFNLASANTVTTGQMAWNAADLTVDIGMANGVTLQVGQEQYIKIKAGEAIADGEAVMFGGATGEHIIGLRNNMSATGYIPEWFIGVATQNFALNEFGYVTVFGKINGLNTLAYTVGDILYANPAVIGGLTKVEPQAPNLHIIVAAVTKRAGGDGHILVRPTFRPKLANLSDVQITNIANNNLIKYNSANSRFENVSASSVIEPAYAQANSALSIAQSAFAQANTGGAAGTDDLARSIANSAFSTANTATTNAATANNQAASAFSKANTATTLAQSAYDFANTIVSDTQVDPFARSQANSAFNQANTATTNASNADVKAQAAYDFANTIVSDTQIDPFARSQANSAFTRANTAYTQANTATTLAQAAYDAANSSASSATAWYTANLAFDTANTKTYTFKQNTAPATANSNDFWANTDSALMYFNFGNTSSPVWVEVGSSGSVNLTGYAVNTTVDLIWSTSNNAYSQANTATTNAATANNQAASAFSKANTATTLAQSAYDFANTIVSDTQIDPLARSISNSAFAQANTATTNAATANNQAASAFSQANSALSIAQSAFAQANTGGAAGTDNVARSIANSAFSTANSAFAKANTGTSQLVNGASTVSLSENGKLTVPGPIGGLGNAKLDFTTYGANVAYLTTTSDDSTALYMGSVSAELYAHTNVQIRTNTAGVSKNWTFNTDGSTTFPGTVDITYTPDTATGSAITINAANTQGGTGYADFLKVTNTSGDATNPNKTFRLNSTGDLEIINSAYDANLFSLTNAGGLSVPGPISVGGKQAVNGPAFRAYVATGQAITSGSQQKVTFGTENFDTNDNFASSRFTPTIEGYYQLNATIRIDGTSSTGEVMIILYKNGSEYARGHNQSGTEQGASFYSMSVSDIAYANGSTDHFEVYIQQSSGGNRNTTAGSPISYFSGSMIRGA